MQVEVLNTHKKYKQTYFKINDQIYTVKQAKLLFGEQFEEFLNKQSFTKQTALKKIYKYPTKKTIKTKIEEKTKELFKKLNLEKTTNIYENYKTANELMFYLVNNTSTDMTIIEDRLFNLKNFTDELKQDSMQIEKAYSKQVYNKDKEYKKTKSLLKKLEKQTKNQQSKMLFNTLVRKKTTNQEDTHTFFELLKELNIKAYKASLLNKENNAKHSLVLVPIKLKKTDAVKYYFYDLSNYRAQLKHKKTNKNKESKEAIKLLGKSDLQNLYENYEVVSFESGSNAYFENEPEFNKIFKQIASTGLQTNYTI